MASPIFSKKAGDCSQHFIFFAIYKWAKKLDFYITIGWRSLPGTNTAAFWAHSKVMKKMNCCEYGPTNPSPVIP
jgi:hypothetical protein